MSALQRFIAWADEVERIALNGGTLRGKTVDPMLPLLSQMKVTDVLELRDLLTNQQQGETK